MTDFPRQGAEDEPVHEPGTEFEDPFLDPRAAVGGSLDEDLALAYEHSGVDVGPGSDEETEEALQSERDERDALVDDDRIKRPWHDESPQNSALRLAAVVGEEIGAYVENVRALYEAGLPEDFLRVPVFLDMMSGGLVIGALQLAGLLVPEVRPQVERVLDVLYESLPDPNEEERELLTAASRKVVGKTVEQLRAQGVTVILADEEESETYDVGLN